jgi:hypothetical protein
MKPEAIPEFELTLQLDGQAIGSIHIKPHQSLVTNAISGQTIPIAEHDEELLGDFVQRYLLTPTQKHFS